MPGGTTRCSKSCSSVSECQCSSSPYLPLASSSICWVREESGYMYNFRTRCWRVKRGTYPEADGRLPNRGSASRFRSTNLRPDFVLRLAPSLASRPPASPPGLQPATSLSSQCPGGPAVEEAYKRMKLSCTELAADAQQQGWKAKFRPVEAGCAKFLPA